MVATDEREVQTAAVLAAAADRFVGRAEGAAVVDRVRAVHHALQRMIPMAGVVIPYAGRVSARFNRRRVEARRAFNHLMELTQAVALLYHAQRSRDEAGRVVSTEDDYVAAAALAGEAMGRASGALPPALRRFWERLQDRVGGGEWTTDHARAGEVAHRSTIYRWLGDLADWGVIVQVEPPRGKVPARWQKVAERANAPRPGEVGQETSIVPLPEEVFAQ
jgi:hypothetical protein